MGKEITSDYRNWLTSLHWQVDFYQRGDSKPRTDREFPWESVDCDTASPVQPMEWLTDNADALWETRTWLHDDLSKLMFDSTLVLRLAGHGRFYFPRFDFDDLVEIVDERPFDHADLPKDYLGLPLHLFDIRLRDRPGDAPIKVVSCKENLNLLNSYRQYFVRRDSVDFSPAPGEVVLDCGACIGDTSLLFAGLVGTQGAVHLFDPIPLHARYCHLQISLNPPLAHTLHINELAVSNRTHVTSGDKSDSDTIAPGGLAIDSFSSTSLDDYAKGNLSRVDYIKMDIEGAEMEAIEGAAEVIRELKPRLAISAYHKLDDFWEIPRKLKSLNPGYELYFGHHSPVSWESVVYAVQR